MVDDATLLDYVRSMREERAATAASMRELRRELPFVARRMV